MLILKYQSVELTHQRVFLPREITIGEKIQLKKLTNIVSFILDRVLKDIDIFCKYFTSLIVQVKNKKRHTNVIELRFLSHRLIKLHKTENLGARFG